MSNNHRLKSSIMNGSLVFYLGQGGQFIDFEEIDDMDEPEAEWIP